MDKANLSNDSYWSQVLLDDMQALEKLYKKYYSSLFVYANKLANDSSIAEDAIQDTFLYMWQHRKEIGSIKSINFYLIRSVRNACLVHIKKKQKFHAIEDEKSVLLLRIEPEELKICDMASAKKSQIKKALDDLSPRQREIIFLKFYNNLDYEEISQLLAINYQSAVNHVYKGIQKLKRSAGLASDDL